MEGLVKECYDAVSRINDEIWCEYDDLYSKGVNVLNKIPTLHLTTDTANVSIFLYIEDDKLILPEILLFSDDYDFREFDEEKDEYEPMYDYLKKMFTRVKERLISVTI